MTMTNEDYEEIRDGCCWCNWVCGLFFLIVLFIGSFLKATFPKNSSSSNFDEWLSPRYYTDEVILPLPYTGGNSWTIWHIVPEGYVGVYWKGGALLKTIVDPGFYWMMPFVTRFEAIQVTIRTDDQVINIQCVTKDGVKIKFGRTQVFHRLRKEYVYDTLLNYGTHYDKTWIYDKIIYEIKRFCNSHTLRQVYLDMFGQIGEMMKEALQRDCTHYAPGVEIIDVRVTKPIIPEDIKYNYEQMEKERIKALIATEKAETHKKISVSEAQMNARLSKIIMGQKLTEKESARRQQEIDDEMFLSREKSFQAWLLIKGYSQTCGNPKVEYLMQKLESQ